MARYMILSKGKSLDVIEKELVSLGAKNVVRHEHVHQISCDLPTGAVIKLSGNPDVVVKPVREIKGMQVPNPYTSLVRLPTPLQEEVDLLTQTFLELRAFYTPPLTGAGLTVAVLDTGIRKTHKSIADKVVHEFNATDSPTCDDVWGHGTGVAYLICGRDNSHSGISPGSYVMNIKVINDYGVATTETIVAGINHVVGLVKEARFGGKTPLDPLCPNMINISIGGEDTDDVDDPMFVAARNAIIDWDIDVIAAAGNSGPSISTIMVPASEPLVIAVGGTEIGGINVWEKSSRGPTLLGKTKPDFVMWATDITVATHKNDTGYELKSGTSFSAPIVAGLGGLLWETGRISLSPLIAPLYVFRWSQIEAYAPYYCVKPADAASIKDNTYGYGTPAGGLMIQQMSQAGQVTTPQQLMQAMPMIAAMAMMVGMIV